jgi:hypothetical protein
MVVDWTSEVSDWRVTHDPWSELVAWDIPCEILRGHRPYPGPDTWPALPALSSLNLRAAFEKACGDGEEGIAAQGYQREGPRYRCVVPHRGWVAVVCHNGLGLIWLAHLLDLPLALVWSRFEALRTAWVERRNTAHAAVEWRFTTADARIKLKKLYPTLKTSI